MTGQGCLLFADGCLFSLTRGRKAAELEEHEKEGTQAFFLPASNSSQCAMYRVDVDYGRIVVISGKGYRWVVVRHAMM